MINFHHILRPRSTGTTKAVITGVISAITAAGITYFFYGTKKGTSKRAKMKRWAEDKRADVADYLSKDESEDIIIPDES